jgi:class I fructose-bisphosphate aldolase
MMSVAKKIRIGRILQRESKRSLIVPIDHGLTLGPLPGIENTHRISRWMSDPHIDAIIAHKGIITRLAERNLLQDRGVILHLNGMNQLANKPDDKEMLTSIETAIHLGVDAVSLQVNFNAENDRANWALLGHVADQAFRHGLPLLTMLYDKVPSASRKARVLRARQLLRVAVELGTDAIKIGMPESSVELEEILDSIHEDVLMFVAGGDVADECQLLAQVTHAIENGASGVCMGRNIFNRTDTSSFLQKLSDVIHGGYSLPITRGELLHAY